MFVDAPGVIAARQEPDERAARGANGSALREGRGAEPFPVFIAGELERMRTPQLVQNLVYGFSVVSGEPNSGKSALAVDLGLHIAAGVPFFGRKVLGGPVLYLASEAPYSVEQRVEATRRLKFAGKRLPFYMSSSALNLGEQSSGAIDAARLIATMRTIEAQEGTAVRAFFVDTAASVMGAGDENGQGMLTLVSTIQLVIRETAAVGVLIHHPGKSDPQGLRGHSSLRGAVDAQITLTTDTTSGIRMAIVKKSRDGAAGNLIHFRLDTVVQAEVDEFGDQITTVVVQTVDALPARLGLRGKNQKKALKALTEWSMQCPQDVISSEELTNLMKSAGTSKNWRKEVLESFIDARVLAAAGDGYRVHRDSLR
ncbi:MAG TPA: AAA family ATPase [Terriglobia bacterium]|nr:AAA family ATPase [Terriglobia bacterium]